MKIFRYLLQLAIGLTLAGCAGSQDQMDAQDTTLSLCAIDSSDWPPPQRGDLLTKCKDLVEFHATIKRGKAIGQAEITLDASEQDQPKIAAFMQRNLRSMAVLRSKSRSVANLMITSGNYTPIELYLDQRELQVVGNLL